MIHLYDLPDRDYYFWLGAEGGFEEIDRKEYKVVGNAVEFVSPLVVLSGQELRFECTFKGGRVRIDGVFIRRSPIGPV